MGNLWVKAALLEDLSTFCHGIHLSTSQDCTPSKWKWRSVQQRYVLCLRISFLNLISVDLVKVLFRLQDSAGRSSVREQHFTLEDGLTPSFGFVQSFILLTDHYILGRLAFIFMMLLNVGVLLAFRFLRVPPGRGEQHISTVSASVIVKTTHTVWINRKSA